MRRRRRQHVRCGGSGGGVGGWTPSLAFHEQPLEKRIFLLFFSNDG